MRMSRHASSFFFLTIAATLILSACSNASGTSANATAASSPAPSGTDSIYYGDNSFTYTEGGHTFAIKDNLKLGEGKYRGALFLNLVENDAANNMVRIKCTNSLTSEVFNFYVANKGTTTILHSKASFADIVNGKEAVATYMDPKSVKNYYGDSVTTTINSIDGKRVSGIFSGSFKTDDKKSAVEITHGSFNMGFKNNEAAK